MAARPVSLAEGSLKVKVNEHPKYSEYLRFGEKLGLGVADPAKIKPRRGKPSYKMSRSLAEQARQVVAALDERGAWVEAGRLRSYGANDPTRVVIETRTFVSNVETLSKFIAASR